MLQLPVLELLIGSAINTTRTPSALSGASAAVMSGSSSAKYVSSATNKTVMGAARPVVMASWRASCSEGAYAVLCAMRGALSSAATSDALVGYWSHAA